MQPTIEYLTKEGWKKDWQETRERNPILTAPMQSARNFLEEQSQQTNLLDTIRYAPVITAASCIMALTTISASALAIYTAQVQPNLYEHFPFFLGGAIIIGLPYCALETYRAADIAQTTAAGRRDVKRLMNED